LGLPEPDITLDTKGETHCEQHSKLILQLEKVLVETKPDVCLFLGDANAVIGCIVPLKLGIPIAHIEAGMRSYDWRMPEERNRVIIDRVSDVLYVYHNNYKCNLVREGINPSRIEVVGNVIEDVLNEHSCDIYLNWGNIKKKLGIASKEYALLTMHRNENVTDKDLAQKYINAVGKTCELNGIKEVILPAMPRLKSLNLKFTGNTKFTQVEPLGFFDFVALEEHAKIEFTDSGTNQEVAALLGVPCVVLRNCTERPECFESNINLLAPNPIDVFGAARDVLKATFNDNFNLGGAGSSERIVNDLVKRLKKNTFTNMRLNPCMDYETLSHFTK
jgi:UDP-N-acetylglucosamine 2-epimerase (non-hydrolysing)